MFFFFFFQAEDGIRDLIVTGVQTCALPISLLSRTGPSGTAIGNRVDFTRKDVREIGCCNGRVTWCYEGRAASVLAADPRVRARVTFVAANATTLELPAGGS